MLVLGLLLVLLAGVAIVAALFGGPGQPSTFDLGSFQLETTALGTFLLGAATVLVLAVGIGLIRVGAGRARRHRQERRELSRLKKQEAHGASDTSTTTDHGTSGATP